MILHHLEIFWAGFWRVTLILGGFGGLFFTLLALCTWKAATPPPKSMKIFAVIFTIGAVIWFCYFIGQSWR